MASDETTPEKQHRSKLRAAGFRPVDIWVPDTNRPGFTEECRRQSLLAAEADAVDNTLEALMDDALADASGWTT